MSNLSSDSNKSVVQLILLRLGQHVPGVKNAGRLEFAQSLDGVLFEQLVGENVIDLFVKCNVVNHERIKLMGEALLKEIVLLLCQEQFLRVQSRAELLLWQVAFS